ncbi:sporulation protein YjcZ [Shouchella tritolerans]|nr:sporulation protein YjcZ [Shouchella tritolerans]
MDNNNGWTLFVTILVLFILLIIVGIILFFL